MLTQLVYKTPDESVTFGIDLSQYVPHDITEILSTEVKDFATETVTTELTVEDIQISSDHKGLLVKLSGGQPRNIYTVQVLFKVANGDQLEFTFYVLVEDVL